MLYSVLWVFYSAAFLCLGFPPHKNANDQHYNGQMAIEHQALLIISNTLSNHPNDQLDALPTVDAIDLRVGKTRITIYIDIDLIT